NLINWSATIAFKTVMELAQLDEDPTALNSNLLPVNANGEVRFRSVLSRFNSGILGIPCHSMLSAFTIFAIRGVSTSSSTLLNWLPIKIEIIAGGASFAPKR